MVAHIVLCEVPTKLIMYKEVYNVEIIFEQEGCFIWEMDEVITWVHSGQFLLVWREEQ